MVLREIWRGQVWSGRACTVVEDTPRRLVLFSAAGDGWTRPVRPDGTSIRMREPNWILCEEVWTTEALRIVTRYSRHSVMLFWTPGFEELLQWYVNIEDPMVRTPIGFDYLDQLLDIRIASDLSGWSWKDEDEFEEAVDIGILTSEEAAAFRSEGESVIAALRARRPPFDEPWAQWRPDPNWPSPALLEGWNDVRIFPACGGNL